MLSVTLSNFGGQFADGEWDGLVRLARRAEEAGVERVMVVDHVVMGPNTGAYPAGTFPGSTEMPWLEPLTVLGAIAGATERLRLATGVIIAPLRPAVVLAKTVATLDQLSRGRVELGVGTGWQREEYDAAGLDWSRRGPMLTDLMGACKALWAPSPARYDSPTVSFDEVWCEPKPVQPGGVPLLVSGNLHPRNLDRIVRFGDGWIPMMGESVAGVGAGVAVLREAFAAAGRDPGTLRVQASLPILRDAAGEVSLGRSLEAVPALFAAGATIVNVYLAAFCPDPERAPEVLAELVAGYRARRGEG
ncbi:TIGR03619 family F420-dependent LLM class oxidoreductase [Actinocorallia longicatena]|uniref:TIGR03619 family F420-dependent LLM class oxidoreductase n=1 Tax=Actinocorallia longicatena TaxID=111803 RepID=A0ABP6Q7X6_9ACTN